MRYTRTLFRYYSCSCIIHSGLLRARVLGQLLLTQNALSSALFVSMEAVRQLPKVHVAEQVWDRAQKAIATRCSGAVRAPKAERAQ